MKTKKLYSWKGLLAMMAALAIFALTPGLAAAESQIGNYCVEDGGASNCTAQDFGIKELYFDSVITPCGADPTHPNQAYVTFKAVLTTARPERYDVSIYIALDGGSAATGDNCLHDYLNAPLTTTPTYIAFYPAGDTTVDDIVDGPWYNGDVAYPTDVCGDMEPNTTVIKTLEPVWIACVDTTGDGHVDVSACGGYNQNLGDICTGVTQAVPGTTAKCGCSVFELPFTPTGIEGLSFSARSGAVSTGLILSALGLLLIGGVMLSLYLRRQAHA